MAINIKTSGYQKRERIAAPLEVYSNTLDTLQQRHENAIETSNKIKTFLANKELNEAENKWLSDYSTQINNQIEAAAQQGSYATALTTASKLAGEVASNLGLIGRERYQKEFKAFQDSVRSSDEYDGDVKAYTLAQNKYNYQDTLDDKGRVTGGTSFTPNYSPVAQADIDEIYRKALSTVGVDASQGEQLVWGDKNGNIKAAGASIVEGDLPYLKTGSGIRKLDANKIRAAVEAAINQTPGARASLNQDYRVNVWKARKGDKQNLVTKKDGTIMTQEEFEENLLAPRYKASAYKHVTSTIDTSIGFSMLNDKRKAERTAAAKANKNTTKEENLKLKTDFYAPSGNRKIEPDTPAKLISSINDNTTKLNNMFAEFGIDKNLTTEQAYARLRHNINTVGSYSDNVRNQKLQEAEHLYNSIQTANNRLTAVNSHMNENERLASEFLGRRLSNGSMTDSSNPYQRRYSEAINRLFTGENGEAYDRVLVKAGGLSESIGKNRLTDIRVQLAGLGFTSRDIRFEKVDGQEYIYISKDAYTKAAPEISEIIGNSSIGFTKGSGTLPSKFENSNGIYQGWRGTGGKSNSIASIYREATLASQSATDRLNTSMPVNYAPLNAFYIPMTITVNGEQVTKNMFDEYTEGAISVLGTADGGSVKILKKNDNGELIEVDSANERNAILKKIGAQVKNKNINLGWGVDPATGDYGAIVSVGYTTKTSKNTAKNPNSDQEDLAPNAQVGTYFISGAILNSEINKFKNIPAVKAAYTLNSIDYNSALSSGYQLSDSEFGDGSYTAIKRSDGLYDISNGRDNMIVNHEDMNNILTGNYANNLAFASVKSNIEKIQARNGTIASSPVEEQSAIVVPLMQKALIDYGVTDLASLDTDGKQTVVRHFNSMYRNLTGETISPEIQAQLIETLQRQ